MVLCPGLVSSSSAAAAASHTRPQRSDFCSHEAHAAASTPANIDIFAQQASNTGSAGPPRSTTPARRATGRSLNALSIEEEEEEEEEQEEEASSASSCAVGWHEQFLLYFLRLMDSSRVAEKKYVVLLCGGGDGDGHGEVDGRGGRAWLSWARFSFLGQLHSLLPRRYGWIFPHRCGGVADRMRKYKTKCLNPVGRSRSAPHIPSITQNKNVGVFVLALFLPMLPMPRRDANARRARDPFATILVLVLGVVVIRP